MRLALASALPLLLIILAMVLIPVLDAEIRRAVARRDRALVVLRARRDSEGAAR